MYDNMLLTVCQQKKTQRYCRHLSDKQCLQSQFYSIKDLRNAAESYSDVTAFVFWKRGVVSSPSCTNLQTFDSACLQPLNLHTKSIPDHRFKHFFRFISLSVNTCYPRTWKKRKYKKKLGEIRFRN